MYSPTGGNIIKLTPIIKNKPVMKDSSIQFRKRRCDSQLLSQQSDLHPVLQRVFSARDIHSFNEINYSLSSLTAPRHITHLNEAAELLAQHVCNQSSILIFGDYDADGATSTALCIKAMNLLGHDNVGFYLPDRFVDGYGISQNAAHRLIESNPQLVITVDTGIASFNGLEQLADANIDVIVTDHHLPADRLPEASVIVNPNVYEASAGKNLAGVGVAFYLMLALRSQLRARAWFESRQEPNLAECLDLVAIGTVADLAPLDFNNRILVHEGLKRIRAGVCSTGIRKIIELSGRSQQNLGSQDIAFSVAPRINAAGRMDDMSVGVQALLAEDEASATHLAFELDNMNSVRRELQGQMTQQAIAMLPEIDQDPAQACFILYQPDWHEGIVGIIASKIKEISFRPTICFAATENSLLKGSGRSITGIHLRDMLDLVNKSEPGLIERFGGHAMAAGLTIDKGRLAQFRDRFEQILQQYADEDCFNNIVEHDGEIEPQDMTMELAEQLRQAGPWGQKFPVPSFNGQFKVLDKRVLADKHLKFVLSSGQNHRPIDAILFNASDKELTTHYTTMQIHYELSINLYRQQRTLQLIIWHIV